uniref:Uncharacterized protein n=1 Tax=Rhizophora mucronata TaxID=61149 RepID=A0A2P2Q9G8_RHIMU
MLNTGPNMNHNSVLKFQYTTQANKRKFH